MKNWIIKIWVLSGIIKIDAQKVNTWILEENVDLLKFSTKNAFYKERVMAIEALQQFKAVSFIPELLKIAENDIEPVAKKAINAITFLDEKKTFLTEIETLEKLWEKRNRKRAKTQTKGRAVWFDKKSRMKNLEMVRGQLQSPMNTGKWL